MCEFSVIIPVYNVEAYLNRCLESVINQFYQNFEIILIDDGSTDTSGKLCDEWEAKDARISVIHQENKGVSAARNAGLDRAKGNFIIFLDSDDFLEKETLFKVSKSMEAGYDVCSFCVRRVDEAGKYLYDMRYPGYIGSYEMDKWGKEDFILSVFLQAKVGWEVWTHVYRRELLQENNIRFSEQIVFGEDLVFAFEVFSKINSYLKLPDILYNYQESANSVMGRTNASDALQKALKEAFGQIRYILLQQGENEYPEYIYFSALVKHYYDTWSEKNDLTSFKQMLFLENEAERRKYLEDSRKDRSNLQKLLRNHTDKHIEILSKLLD